MQYKPFIFSGLWSPIEDADLEPPGEGGEIREYLLLPLQNMVIYPQMVTPLIIESEMSLAAAAEATRTDTPVMVVTQVSEAIEAVEPRDLHTVGTEVIIGQLLRTAGDRTTSAIVHGRQRLEIVEFTQVEPFFKVRARAVVEPEPEPLVTEALVQSARGLFLRYVQLDQMLPEEASVYADSVTTPGALADLIAATINIDLLECQATLETFDPAERLRYVVTLMGRELSILEIEDDIHDKVQQELDRNQREFYLREQVRVIQAELGEGELWDKDVIEFRVRIGEADLPPDIRSRALEEVERLAKMPPMAPETGVLRAYLNWLLDLPWSVTTEDNFDLKHAKKLLDRDHYGLMKAKERILEYIAVRSLAADKMRQPILCFVGPPGTGKTSLGKSIAESLGRKFVRLSLGGVRDEAEIRGHRRTYIGALPGRIIQTIKRAGTVNPVFMLDEIDKLGFDFRGDPTSALLEVFDPEQNHTFSDHYLEVPFDLSKVMFIATANYLGEVPAALEDRMEVIEFRGYVDSEKLAIARNYLIPKQLDQNGLEPGSLTLPEATLRSIIREYTYEAGVRDFDRQIARICRQITRRKVEGRRLPRRITSDQLARYLGPPQYIDLDAEKEDSVGVATSLAWTYDGGSTTTIEVVLIPDGRGGVKLTGQLGMVMRESFQAAFSYMRLHAKSLGIKPKRFNRFDVHVHAPEGAVYKEGPSAGVTLATALVSAFTKVKVRKDVGMTGEITLRGHILAVGGVKEKLVAAHRIGLRVVVLPKKNEKDLMEVPPQIRKGLDIRLVETLDEVLEIALVKVPKPPRRRPAKRFKRVMQQKKVTRHKVRRVAVGGG